MPFPFPFFLPNLSSLLKVWIVIMVKEKSHKIITSNTGRGWAVEPAILRLYRARNAGYNELGEAGLCGIKFAN